MRRSSLLALVACLVAAVLAGAGAALLFRGTADSPKTIAGGTAANTPGAVRAGLQKCIDVSTGQEGVFQQGVDCYKGVLRSALQNDRFDEVISMAKELGYSDTGPVCHNAGHQLGLELTKAGWTMDAVVRVMFHGKAQQETEYSCATPLIHGMVQGKVAGDPPYDMDYLAGQCLALEAIHPQYANECAHYYGHATWKTVQAITPELATLCAKLAAGVKSDAENSCMGGAVMTSYGLQEGYGDPAAVQEQKKAPSYDDVTTLCDPLKGGREQSYVACWGGTGWLLATRAIHTIGSHPTKTPEGRDAAVAEYLEALNHCYGNLCLDNFITHFRLADYHDGVVERVCLSPDLNPEFDMEHLLAVCEMQMQKRAGLSLGTPARQSDPAQPAPASAAASPAAPGQ